MLNMFVDSQPAAR